MKKILVFIFFGLSVFSVSASEAPSEYSVGIDSFNLFEFPSPVREAILPEDAPLKGDARYVNGNKGVLLKFNKEASEPFQMVVMLKSGGTHMITLTPDDEIAGQSYKVGDFTKTVNRRALSSQSNPNADYLPVLAEKLARLNDIPKGFFVSETKPKARMFRGADGQNLPLGLVLQPIERLEGSVEGRKIYIDMFHVEASAELSAKDLDPSQFTEKGVGAITVTRDAEGETFLLIVRNAN